MSSLVDDFTEKRARWFDALLAAGHNPEIDSDGQLNAWAYDNGHHNGPGCKDCGWACCWHCKEIPDIPKCRCTKKGRKHAS